MSSTNTDKHSKWKPKTNFSRPHTRLASKTLNQKSAYTQHTSTTANVQDQVCEIIVEKSTNRILLDVEAAISRAEHEGGDLDSTHAPRKRLPDTIRTEPIERKKRNVETLVSNQSRNAPASFEDLYDFDLTFDTGNANDDDNGDSLSGGLKSIKTEDEDRVDLTESITTTPTEAADLQMRTKVYRKNSPKYFLGKIKANFGISDRTWSFMMDLLMVYQVHTNLFPNVAIKSHADPLRSILARFNIQRDINDIVFMKFCGEFTVNRCHLKDLVVKNIQLVFHDLNFNVIEQPPPVYKKLAVKERKRVLNERKIRVALQQHEIIKHLSANRAFIYERDASKQRYSNKFHGPYLTNTIGVLLTRVPAIVKEGRLSIPLLATGCTLLHYVIVDYGFKNFTEREWAPKYEYWVKQIEIADRQGKIDWTRLLTESRVAIQKRFGATDLINEYDELPDEVPFDEPFDD